MCRLLNSLTDIKSRAGYLVIRTLVYRFEYDALNAAKRQNTVSQRPFVSFQLLHVCQYFSQDDKLLSLVYDFVLMLINIRKSQQCLVRSGQIHDRLDIEVANLHRFPAFRGSRHTLQQHVRER